MVGVDVSETLLAMASARTSREPATERIEFHLGDATPLPFEEATFDGAVAT